MANPPSGEYSHLLSPIKIGTHTWKNRIVKGPSSTLFAGPDQFVNDVFIGPYEAIAKGGAAAVIIGAMLSDDPKMLIEEETLEEYPFGYRGYPFAGLYDDKFIPKLQDLTDSCHKYGCEIIAQIFQNGAALQTKGGSWCSSTIAEENLPTPIPNCWPTRGLTLDEISAFKKRYIDAAERAKKAGFDGVEVHSANGYLILSFVSRIWNHRDDEYGCQNIENRTRLPRELIEGIKERCGEDFIVGVRLNGQEFGHADGITMDESAEIAQWLEKAGADYISVTGYGYGPHPMEYAADFWMTPEPNENMQQFLPRAKDGLMIEPATNIKKNVSIPVFGVSTLTPEKAEKFISEGRFDVSLYSRGLWADSDMANKLLEGRPQDVRRCNRCGTCDQVFDAPYRRICRVNPNFGHERERAIAPAETIKNVLVVGGGIAGTQAASIAAQRGHQVTLCEKKSALTMKPILATMVKGTECEQVPFLIDYLKAQSEKYPNLTVRFKTEVTPSLVKSLAPDVIIVATGGKYGTPNIPGIDSRIVKTVPQLEKLAEKPLKMLGANAISNLSKIALPTVGKRCVVLGGQLEGIQGAVFLRSRGKEVTVLEESNQIAQRMPARYVDRDLPWLEKNGVNIINNIQYKSIDKKGVTYIKDGIEKRIECDTVMVFMSPGDNKALYESVKDMAPEVYSIGSCNGAEESCMVDAMREGYEVALLI